MKLRIPFWPTLAALLLLLATVQVATMSGETQTWDEGIEIASGYGYVRTGEYRIAIDHPPLARLIAIIPLLWLNPSMPSEEEFWKLPGDVERGQTLLYQNRVAADDIVFVARIPMVIATVLLAGVAAWWTRRSFGPAAGLLCAAMFVFDPNILAIGHYVKLDILVTLFGFLSVAAWGEYLATSRFRWLLAAGLGFGLAVMTKFAAMFLLPAYALLWLVDRWHRSQNLALWRGFVSSLAIIAIAAPIVVAAYGSEWRKLRPATRAYRAEHPEVRRLGDVFTPQVGVARDFVAVCQRLGCQDHSLLLGFGKFLEHASTGHQAYLLGEVRETGWWYYYPFAFLVKTPVATLCLVALAVVSAIWRWWNAPLGFLRSLSLVWWLCTIPVVLFLVEVLMNHVDTGVRLLFPMYPFLFAGVAGIVAGGEWGLRKLFPPVMAALLLIESAAAYPHYTAYFNFAAGGPEAGPRYLLDSNIDWGQDLHHLRAYWEAQGRPKLCLEYFGTALPEYYGLSPAPVPRTGQPWESADCLAALSVTLLYDLYISPPTFSWLRERTPASKIGYSIYVYDLRKDTLTGR